MNTESKSLEEVVRRRPKKRTFAAYLAVEATKVLLQVIERGGRVCLSSLVVSRFLLRPSRLLLACVRMLLSILLLSSGALLRRYVDRDVEPRAGISVDPVAVVRDRHLECAGRREVDVGRREREVRLRRLDEDVTDLRMAQQSVQTSRMKIGRQVAHESGEGCRRRYRPLFATNIARRIVMVCRQKGRGRESGKE